jgi:hypothetical protein
MTPATLFRILYKTAEATSNFLNYLEYFLLLPIFFLFPEMQGVVQMPGSPCTGAHVCVHGWNDITKALPHISLSERTKKRRQCTERDGGIKGANCIMICNGKNRT